MIRHSSESTQSNQVDRIRFTENIIMLTCSLTFSLTLRAWKEVTKIERQLIFNDQSVMAVISERSWYEIKAGMNMNRENQAEVFQASYDCNLGWVLPLYVHISFDSYDLIWSCPAGSTEMWNCKSGYFVGNFWSDAVKHVMVATYAVHDQELMKVINIFLYL